MFVTWIRSLRHISSFCLFQFYISVWVMAGLSMASVALAPPASLPDLFPVLVSVASFLHLLGFFIYFHIVQFSQLGRKSNRKNKWAAFWPILCEKIHLTRQSWSWKSTRTKCPRWNFLICLIFHSSLFCTKSFVKINFPMTSNFYLFLHLNNKTKTLG